MRPTNLGFRSPKEKTPDAYYPLVTNNGKSLGFSSKTIKGTFSQSRRFTQYELDAKRTGYRIGPGCYTDCPLEITKPKRGGPVYKAYHGGKDVTNNGYFYIGNSLVFDPAFVLKSRKSSLINYESTVEYSRTTPQRPSTAKARYDSRSNFTPFKDPGQRPLSARASYKSHYAS